MAEERDGAEKLEGLLDLMPQFDVVLSGVGVIARRRSGLDFVANGPGMLNWILVTLNDKPIYKRQMSRVNVSAADTVALHGRGAGQIADAIYDAIEKGALLNESS